MALPLEGLKVLDFTWVVVGPFTTRYLGDYGATIVRVESTHRVDTARTLQPFKDGQPGPERSGLYANINANKLGLQLNMATPEGREVALELAKWADVITENYSPKAMKAWGLDYESVRKVNPGVIMFSTCLNGQTGPDAMQAGIGTMGVVVAGFGELTGWPDRIPAGPWGAYTDYIGPKFFAASILAALDHRRRTGEGQYIDASQVETAIHFIGPAVLDYTVNGRVIQRAGNASPYFSPHGVYRAAGVDNWVAIVARDEGEWAALCEVAGHPEWRSDPRFATLPDRLRNRAELDALIEGWTAQLDADDVEALLVAAGVAAHRVARSADVFADPQVAHRGHFTEVDHPVVGRVPLETSRMRFSRTPAKLPAPGPTYGQHTHQVLTEILGYDDDRIAALAAAGALE
jgi:benzylsuccinate CoA-transferase BbsF subunit